MLGGKAKASIKFFRYHALRHPPRPTILTGSRRLKVWGNAGVGRISGFIDRHAASLWQRLGFSAHRTRISAPGFDTLMRGTSCRVVARTSSWFLHDQ